MDRRSHPVLLLMKPKKTEALEICVGDFADFSSDGERGKATIELSLPTKCLCGSLTEEGFPSGLQMLK